MLPPNRSWLLFLATLLAALPLRAQTAITWQLAGNGTWSTASNWSGSTLPGLSSRAVLSTGQTITGNGASSISVGAFDLSSASGQAVFDFSNGGAGLALGSFASTWSAGTVEFRNSSGVAGNGTANTTINVSSGGQVMFDTLTGTRYVQSLTFANAGNVTATTGTLSFYGDNVTNASGALIHANGATVDFASNTSLTNAGTLRATGSSGILRFDGALTTANLGSVDLVSGGHAYVAGTIDNTSSTLAAPTGGSFELLGGVVTGGNIANGAVTFTTSGGYVSGASLASDLTLPASAYVRFNNGATFAGGNATFANSSALYWEQAGTLDAKAISMAANSLLYVRTANATLALGPATTVTGDINLYTDGSAGTAITNQGTIVHSTQNTGDIHAPTLVNSGSITNSATSSTLFIGSTSSGYNTTNTGNITVNASGATIYLDGNVDNTGGTLNATNGQLILRGNNTAAHLNAGTINISGGAHAYLNGTIDNTSATLNAPTSGKYELDGGTITGGTIAQNALTYTGSGGYLDATTLNEDLTLPSNSYVRFTHGAAIAGANLTFGTNANLYWQQTGALSGKSITFGTNGLIYVATGNSSLTLGSTTTGTGDLNLYTDGSSGTAIVNQGTLTHTSGSSGTISALSLTNSGNISNTSTNGALFIGSTSNGYNTTNTGTITVNGTGATIYLDGNVDNTGGTLTATNGQFIFRGSNTAGQLNAGTINIASGAHAYLNGTIANAGTLNAPTGGIYELYGGTITGGTIAPGALTFTGSGGYLDGTVFNDDFSLPANDYVRFTNGTSIAGGNLTLGSNGGIYWQQNGTLAGKTITFGNNGYLYVAGGNHSLTLGNSTTGTGDISVYTDGSTGTAITNQGTLTHTSGSGTLNALSFSNAGNISVTGANTSLVVGSASSSYNTTNTGNITVNASGATIYLDGNVDNTGGTMTASNGQLIFRGNNTSAHVNGGTISVAAGAHAYLNGVIDNTAATLLAPAAGIFELYGGTITGGTIAPGALTFTTSGGDLDGTVYNDDFSLPTNDYVRFTNGASIAGANLTLGGNGGIYWQQNGTLAGKTIAFGSNGYLYVSGANHSLTLDPTTNGSGQVQVYTDGSTGTAVTLQGTLTHTSGSGWLYAPALANSGNISVTGANTSLQFGVTSNGYNSANTGNISVNASGATIYLDGNVDSTGGTLTASNGQLIFRGPNTSAHLNGGSINIAAGAHAYLNGTLDNTAGLNVPASGIFELYGGTIRGGTIAAGALTFTSSGGLLDGSTFNGALTLPSSAYVRLQNNASFTGSAANFGANSSLYWQQSGSLTGKALTFGDGASLYVSGANHTVTLDSATTATGEIQIYSDGSAGTAITNQGNITHTRPNSGWMYAPTLANSGTIANTGVNSSLFIGSTSNGYNTTNTGNITVNASTATIYLDGNFDNTGGTLNATSGQLIFRGNNTTAHLNGGTTNIGTGHAYLNGTLDNSSATLAAPVGGPYELLGGTIDNGTIASGALSYTGSGGTLNNASLLGNVTLPAGSYAYWSNGTNLGTAQATLSLGASSGIYWKQTGTLGNTSVTFGANSYVYLNGGNATLTLAPTATAAGDVEIYSDGSAGTSLTNQGAITHTNGTGYLYAQSFSNAGNISVTGGTLYLGTGATGATVANNAGALLQLNGGNLALQQPAANPLVNQGVIDVRSGTFFTNNRLTNGAAGTIEGAGTISGNLIIAGGAVSPGNSGIGSLIVSGGTLTVTGAATFAVDLGSNTSDQLVFQSPGGIVDIGSGLLTLSLNLLNAPTANATFNLISVTNGSGISGSFAGLPNNGDTVTANFGGTPFAFAIDYQPNAISLVTVPEPSTYLLMASSLLALLGAAKRRRR